MLILEVTHLPLKFHLDSLRFERGFCVCIFEAPLVSSSCCLGLFLRRSLLEREGLRRARRLQSEAAPDARARLTRQAADGARQLAAASGRAAASASSRRSRAWSGQKARGPTKPARGPRASIGHAAHAQTRRCAFFFFIFKKNQNFKNICPFSKISKILSGRPP